LKKHFRIIFEVEKTGPYERWAWYANEKTFIKALAMEFEAIYRRKVFIKVLLLEGIKYKKAY